MAGVWQRLKIGGGGYITGLDKSNDETSIVARSDTYGAYCWNTTTLSWDQLVTKASLRNVAAVYSDPEDWPGVAEIAVAPSNSSILYMWLAGAIFRSDNRGEVWTHTGLAIGTINEELGRSSESRMGQRIAVDPNDPHIVYVGSLANGVYRTFDGGRSWELISTATIPVCDIVWVGLKPGHCGICFDATSGTTNGRTNTIYVPTYGKGVRKSTDAGQTWSFLTGGPGRVLRAKCAHGNYYPVEHGISLGFDAQSANFTLGETVTGGTSGATGLLAKQLDSGTTGTLYMRTSTGVFVDNEALTGSVSGAATANGTPVKNESYLHRYNGSVWANITPSGIVDIEGVLIDPSDATRIIAVGSGSTLYRSEDSGASYTQVSKTRSSPDIPWLEYTTEDFMSLGEMIWVGGEIWNAHGIGVAKAPFSGTPASVTWTYITKGIENLTCNEIICPPGGPVVTASWDRAFHVTSDPEVYPSVHYPDSAFRHAWDVDYASSDPTVFVGLGLTGAAVSSWPFGWKATNSGATWTRFATDPGATGTIPLQSGGFWLKAGGCVAASTPNNFICVPANDSLPWYTKDGGATWSEIVIAGVPTSGETGFNWTYLIHMKCVAADRVAANTFYLFNYVTKKVYRSTDGGDTWAVRNAVDIPNLSDGGGVSSQAHLKSVPGQEGHLFMAGGIDGSPGSSNPGSTKLLRSTDGGATWAEIPGFTIREPHSIGFGKAAPGGSYPAVVFDGWLDGVYGIWESVDNCASWTNLGTPRGWFGRTRAIVGSLDTYGTWFQASSGSSFFYRTEAMQYGMIL